MENIGKTFIVQGFNEPRTLKIVNRYLLAGKYPAYSCAVISASPHFKIGDRENFLKRDIIRKGQLVDKIKALTA